MVETSMEKLHRLLKEALAAELFDEQGVRSIQSKVADTKESVEKYVSMVEKRLATLRSLPAPDEGGTTTQRPKASKLRASIPHDRHRPPGDRYPMRYRRLLEVIAKVHPDGWRQFAEENPQYALKCVQCKLDEGEVMAVHSMMTRVRPKTVPTQRCHCGPCVSERERSKEVAARKSQQQLLQQQLQDLRNKNR